MRSPTRGRRPGSPDTRAEILAAAQRAFGELGFGAATIRGIAADAGVDPALVHHYFGSKEDLFLASLQIGLDPRAVIGAALAPGLPGAAERLLRAFLTVWDDPALQPALLGLARSLVEPSGQRMLREGFVGVVLVPAGQALGIDHVEHRMSLVASQVLGLIMARYLLRLEPLASLPGDAVVVALAPTLQRYLESPEVVGPDRTPEA